MPSTLAELVIRQWTGFLAGNHFPRLTMRFPGHFTPAMWAKPGLVEAGFSVHAIFAMLLSGQSQGLANAVQVIRRFGCMFAPRKCLNGSLGYNPVSAGFLHSVVTNNTQEFG